jgi:hypothetical protein
MRFRVSIKIFYLLPIHILKPRLGTQAFRIGNLPEVLVFAAPGDEGFISYIALKHLFQFSDHFVVIEEAAGEKIEISPA